MSLAPYSDGFGVEPGIEGCNHGSLAVKEVFDAADEALMKNNHHVANPEPVYHEIRKLKANGGDFDAVDGGFGSGWR
ncbi:hypothetical protein F0562_007367 [Nyssa sinensis]|uniref:Uncharacterized protein n=1 Tax=Nyssa sinensis TaxID=561372 RepID=A0A5J5A6N6_9ASTE|nr:hypothetical protein F0562_007367 [Nyssa sinensis]